jgi:AcrR family transcriptional regulator
VPRAPRMTAEDRREQILDITLREIRARGMQGLSIEAVAKGAGVTRPLVYTLFDDLDGLLDALAEREEPRALADVQAAIPTDLEAADPDALLTQGVALFVEAVRAQPDRWHLILLPPDGTPAGLHQRIERNRAAILAQLELLVAWGLRRRGGPDLDPELTARMILTLAQDAARLVLADPRAYSTERIAGFTTAAMALLDRPEAA